MRISDWSSDVCSSDLPLTTPDDVRFLDHLIDDAIATFGVDPHRIYMGGYSGGAMMTLRYACEVPGRIAGTALVGAQMITTLAAKCDRSEEHTSELQSLMRISYAVFCLQKKTVPRQKQTL